MTARHRRILTALANHDNLHVQYKMSGAVIEHNAIGRVTFAELGDLINAGLIQKVPILDEYEISEKGRRALESA